MARQPRPYVTLTAISVAACAIIYAVHQQQQDERQVLCVVTRCVRQLRPDDLDRRCMQRMKDGLVRDEKMYNEKLAKFKGSQ